MDFKKLKIIYGSLLIILIVGVIWFVKVLNHLIYQNKTNKIEKIYILKNC